MTAWFLKYLPKGLGCEIGGGGRYNHLIGRFGRDLPSTGFAFDVDRLFQSMERVDGEPVQSDINCLICSATDRPQDAFETARVLRQAGCNVILGHVFGTGSVPAVLCARRDSVWEPE